MSNGTFDSDGFLAKAKADASAFVDALSDLTARGNATWVRQKCDPGYVHCFVAGEQIIFKIYCGPKPEISYPASADLVDGICADYRNAELLYLPGAAGWVRLVELLLAAPESDSAFQALRQAASVSLFEDLFRLWKR